VKRSQPLLAVAGLALAVWSMSYGFYYAVWVEHQTLDRIGGSLAGAFQKAATREMDASRAKLADYARAKYVYTREVDAHSHWIGLAMVLLVMAAVWDRLAFGEKGRSLLALALIGGSLLFPLGVLLQNLLPSPDGQVIALGGTSLLLVAFVLVAVGLAMERVR